MSRSFSTSGRRIGRSFAEVVAKVIAHICELSVLIVQVQMRLKIRVQYELHTQLSILLMQINFVDEHPQMRVTDVAFRSDGVQQIDAGPHRLLSRFNARLSIAVFVDLLLRTLNGFVPLLQHHIIDIRMSLITDSLHQNLLHFIFEDGYSLLQPVDLPFRVELLRGPVFGERVDRFPVRVRHLFHPQQFFVNEIIQNFLPDEVCRTVFFAIPVVGVADVLHPPAALRKLSRPCRTYRVAVRTFNDTRIAVYLLPRRCPDPVLHPLLEEELCLLPCLSVNDGRNGVFMPVLLLRRNEPESLVNLVRPGFVADERSRIEFVFQDTLDGRTDPKLLFGYLRPCMWDIFAEQRLLVVCRSVYAVGIQFFGDLLETVSVKVKLEDQPDGVGGFFNDHDLPGVLVLEVTEGRDDHDPFFLLLPVGGTYLPAGILGIHVVDDLFHPDDKVVVLIAGIDVLSDGYHTHVMLFEVVDEYRSLCAVAAEARKVFYDDRIDLVLFHCFTYFFDPVPVEVHAADIVVKGFAGDGESVFLSISGNDAALIRQGIEFFVLIP